MSNEAKRTPGPWVEGPAHPSIQCREVVADGAIVAVVQTGEADARLIAAAPDLLAVVEMVVEHFKDTDAPLGLAALDALTLARGEV